MLYLESPLECKENQLVHPKGNQSWMFIGRTDAEAETPVLRPPDGRSWLIWKDPDAGKDWRWEAKGTAENEMVAWHHWLNGHQVTSVVSDSLWPHRLQHARLPCPSPTPGVYSNSCPLSWWCNPTISFSVVPFSSRLQSFPASGSFQRSQFVASGGLSIGISASALAFQMNIQDWFPLGWIGWISLQSKGLSRVFSNTTVQKHQFFCTQLSL